MGRFRLGKIAPLVSNHQKDGSNGMPVGSDFPIAVGLRKVLDARLIANRWWYRDDQGAADRRTVYPYFIARQARQLSDVAGEFVSFLRPSASSYPSLRDQWEYAVTRFMGQVAGTSLNRLGMDAEAL